MAHKTLGQIAYEQSGIDIREWANLAPHYQAKWESAAKAVADELRKDEWICTRCGIRQDSKHESHGDF